MEGSSTVGDIVGIIFLGIFHVAGFAAGTLVSEVKRQTNPFHQELQEGCAVTRWASYSLAIFLGACLYNQGGWWWLLPFSLLAIVTSDLISWQAVRGERKQKLYLKRLSFWVVFPSRDLYGIL